MSRNTGDAVTQCLVLSTLYQGVQQVQACTGRLYCVLGQDTSHSVTYFTQRYEWGPVNLMQRLTLQWSSIPSRGKRIEIFLVAETSSNVRSFIILPSEEGLASCNKNNRANFSGEKNKGKRGHSGLSIFLESSKKS